MASGGRRRQRAFIGSFTAAGGLGVLTAAVAPDTGALTVLSAVDDVPDPSYLAFARAPNLWRPLITMGVGAAVTTFVSAERVRAGAHFPSDVIAGAIAGAGIGVIVAHIHRSEDVKQRRIWVGGAPSNGGGAFQVGGVF